MNEEIRKICTGCGDDKILNDFHMSKSGKYGRKAVCKQCKADEAIVYRNNNREKISVYSHERYKNNRTYFDEYNEKNQENIKEWKKEHYRKNKEKIIKQASDRYKTKKKEISEYNREYRKNNRGRINANTARRSAQKRSATPPWLTENHWKEIEAFYVRAAQLTLETNIKHEVDHMVPLMGRNVRGLHVPWNLQVLTKYENRKKGFNF